MDFVALWPAEPGAGNEAQRAFAACGFLGNASAPAEGADLVSYLPAAACDRFRSARRGGRAAALLLDPALPEGFQRAPWEGLLLDGAPLADAAVVVRRAAANFVDTSGWGRAACITLFPRAEFDFPRRLEPLVEDELLALKPPGNLSGLDGFDDLFVLAHGGSSGLLGRDGLPFVIPDDCALPGRVWLLACDVGGALAKLAEDLLARGVREVVAATGELDAAQMVEIVEGWLAKGRREPALHWLAARRRAPARGDGGARSLTLWGGAELDTSEAGEWNAKTWRAERDCAPRQLMLDDRNREDFDRARGLANAATLWPATRQWLVPQLLWLAERFGHVEMIWLLPQVAGLDSPAAEHALADVAYRLGKYPEAARHLCTGLDHAHTRAEERTHLLGSLANLLIDQNLPGAARFVADLHEDNLLADPQQAAWVDLKRLDWTARLALRNGDFEAARQAMERKRMLAALMPAGDEGRELAWLLYFAAWQGVAGAARVAAGDALADEALGRVASCGSAMAVHGNDDEPYLLRALTAWAWANPGWASAERLVDCLPMLREGLAAVNPGPWAFSIAFLHLAGHAGVEDFTRAINALKDCRYFLEASGFAALADDRRGAKSALDRYRQRRQLTLAELECYREVHDIAGAELASRIAAEETLLDGGAGEIARSGVFPM